MDDKRGDMRSYDALSDSTRELIDKRHSLVCRLKEVLIASLDLKLDTDEIDEDEPLFGYGLGLDSIDALQLVIGVERVYVVTLPADDLMIYRSINTLADYLLKVGAQECEDAEQRPSTN
jgi:acyl carrier protein